MLYVCLIVVFASLVLRDQGAVGAGGELPLASLGVRVAPALLLWLIPLLHAILSLAVHFTARRALHAIERTNSLRPVETLDTIVNASRITGAALTAVSICLLGHIDAIRAITGDTVLIDEALAVAPFLLMVTAGWWSAYPVERLLKDATFIRDLDEGRPIYPPPSRAAYVWSQARHHLFILLLPMTLMLILSESTNLIAKAAVDQAIAAAKAGDDVPAGWLAPLGQWLTTQTAAVEWTYYGTKLAGLLLIIFAVPIIIRSVWDTAPLTDGPIAEGLLKMCRDQRVRVRSLLIWRTGGTMINGAVLGVFGRARYILLTDALLDLLPNHFVQAVMAHEIGHVRCKHVPWLTATLFAASGICLTAFSYALKAVAGLDINRIPVEWQLGASVLSLAIAIAAFGYVSRRFEWQADAFAVKHISIFTPPTDDPAAPWQPSSTVTRPAIAAMCGALEIVAQANHIPRSRFTFRHGSIATRIDRLRALDGLPLSQIPIDAVSTRLKWAIALSCAIVITSAFELL